MALTRAFLCSGNKHVGSASLLAGLTQLYHSQSLLVLVRWMHQQERSQGVIHEKQLLHPPWPLFVTAGKC